MTHFTLAALAALAVTGAPAFAAQPDSTVRAVRTADLDLATAGGVRTLHHRIAVALESACGSYEGTDNVAGADDARAITQCRIAASAQADQRVAAILAANTQLASAR